MEKLYEISNRKALAVSVSFKRFLFERINLKDRMIGIKGARGTGKTTLLLQKMSDLNSDKSLYISLDDIYFTENTLVDTTDEFVRKGGEYLFIDEVHKYPRWSQELKNIYDNYPGLKVVFTSSSVLEIHKGKHDLSRRALVFELNGLSFREFINLKYNKEIETVSLQDIISGGNDIYTDIVSQLKPYQIFEQYLRFGYYPYFIENEDSYLVRLNEAINLVIEVDLPAIERMDQMSLLKIKKLLYILGSMVPYTPNINKLAQQLNSTRDSVLKYLQLLHRAHILKWLTKDAYGINFLNKPDKLYLENSNIAYALQPELINIGTIMETFFLNQLSQVHSVLLPKKGDFLVDGKYTFEIGGKSKTQKQIAGIENAYVVADNIEFRHENKLPLWIFGFLY